MCTCVLTVACPQIIGQSQPLTGKRMRVYSVVHLLTRSARSPLVVLDNVKVRAFSARPVEPRTLTPRAVPLIQRDRAAHAAGWDEARWTGAGGAGQEGHRAGVRGHVWC